MKLSRLEEQTISLAGVMQACQITDEIAQLGMTSNDNLDSCIKTIFVTDPNTFLDVYGEIGSLALGLKILKDTLSNWIPTKYRAANRNCLAILMLERQLVKSKNTVLRLSQGIEEIRREFESKALGPSSSKTTALLSNLYKQTISQLGPKIIVKGQPKNLTIGVNTERIRSLLLSGIRSAVLWRQVGGRRRDLVFRRTELLSCCQGLNKN
ncbi:MAG: lysogenization regulator HflD [Gammaproteobacteria bacterium]|nr:lysogenization regulator HflD [Gammaproteobacteria bacterium]|tara:strand:- start:1342 stop:1971 length:630 start_codon:yes stop_codon:yes gene_type:complete